MVYSFNKFKPTILHFIVSKIGIVSIYYSVLPSLYTLFFLSWFPLSFDLSPLEEVYGNGFSFLGSGVLFLGLFLL